MSKPLILVTNDDGITAKGIASLVEVAKNYGDVVVVAPDQPQSGMGHAITVNKPLRMAKANVFEGVQGQYTSTGTPVDCVKLAIYEILKRKPDVILSGVNHGSNASTNVLYSGTMSAAIEGALEGVPSIGFSLLDFDAKADFTLSKKVVALVLDKVLGKSLDPNVCLNVNIPKVSESEFKGLKAARQAKASWDDQFDKRQDPFGHDYYWITGKFEDLDHGSDTDIWALKNNYASVVPIQFDLTAYHEMAKLNTLMHEEN